MPVLVRVILAALLVGALGAWPYAYYELLRWVVAGSAFYLAAQLWPHRRGGAWIWIVVGVMFNPIWPVRLDRLAWNIADVLVAVLLLFAGRNHGRVGTAGVDHAGARPSDG